MAWLRYLCKTFSYLITALVSGDCSGQTMDSGYGGDGKSVEPHSYAAIVTAAMCGPKSLIFQL